MTIPHTSLPDYLFHALLEALRRDLRREEAARACAAHGSDEAFRHGINTRFNLEILQFLMPRTASRYHYRPRKQQFNGGVPSGYDLKVEHELAAD